MIFAKLPLLLHLRGIKTLGVRVYIVKWFEAGILSQQSGFDSCQNKPQKRPKASVMINFARRKKFP